MKEYLLIDYKNGVIASIDHPQLFEKQKHTFFRFESKSPNQRVSYIALYIASYFFKNVHPNTKKMKTDITLKQVNWKDPFKRDGSGQPLQHQSVPLNYKKIRAHLLEHRKYDYEILGLPEFVSFWMDRSADAAMNFYHKNEEGEITWIDGLLAQQYGDEFPIKARLNQEGILITSFGVLITRRIINMRNYLVNESHLFHTSNWIFGLKELLNDVVSLLDITLNQLYLKAKYHKKKTWSFNIQTLGQIHNRRLTDKLKWVKLITGKDLNIEKQKKALDNIRRIRNHLNHFDPPVFSATLQEISTWLNEVMDIIYIILLIRECAGEHQNNALIELYLQPNVVYSPYAPRNGEVKHEGFGYKSVQYPSEHK